MFLPIILLAFLVGGLLGGVELVKKRTETRSKASGSDVRLSLVASPQTVSVGQTFTVVLYIDPSISNYHIAETDVTITYPSSLVTLQGIEFGNFFGQYHAVGQTAMLNKNDITTPGIAKIILGSPCTVAAPWVCYPTMSQTMTVGELARLTFVANTPGTADIAFDASNVTIAAREYADPANTVNVVDTNFLSPIAVNVAGTPPTSTPTQPQPTNTPAIPPTREPRATITPAQ